MWRAKIVTCQRKGPGGGSQDITSFVFVSLFPSTPLYMSSSGSFFSPLCSAQAGTPCGGNHLAEGTLVSTVGIFRQPFGFNLTCCNLSCGRRCATFLNKGNASQEGKVSVKERERMGLMTQKEQWKKWHVKIKAPICGNALWYKGIGQ